MFYRAILLLHLFLMAATCAASALGAAARPSPVSAGCGILTLAIVAIFSHYCLDWKPGKMATLIEIERTVWTQVLNPAETRAEQQTQAAS
jgi:hypothetical protein